MPPTLSIGAYRCLYVLANSRYSRTRYVLRDRYACSNSLLGRYVRPVGGNATTYGCSSSICGVHDRFQQYLFRGSVGDLRGLAYDVLWHRACFF